MAQVIKMRIQFRRDTTENWLLNKDIIPAAGEPCYDLNLKTLKVGDGTTTYENLPIIGGEKSVAVTADGKSIVLKDDVFQLMGFDSAEVGAQPRKNADGFIEWVVPSQDESMDTLLVEVDALRTDITKLQNIVTPSGDDAVPLLTRIEALETKMDGTDEGSVDAKIDAKIEAFATNLTADGKVNTLMELINYVESHGTEAANMASDIKALQELVGSDPVADQIETLVNVSEKKSNAMFEHVKYEIAYKPYGTLVDYRDKEIRVMCPADTEWVLQNVGPGGDGSKYYIGFKAYAPDGAVSFKEDLAEIIADDTMYSFEGNDFAGVDEYGRKYSVVWLPAAVYDADTDSWTYYGANSSVNKYLGWPYSVEWYDANGKKIASDCIRIHLTNESCHSAIEPFWMNKAVKEVAVNGTLLDVVDGRVDITIAEQSLGLKSSDEIIVNEDGTLSIGTISINKITQEEDEVFIMDGGGAV